MASALRSGSLGGGLARLAGFLGLLALQADVHVELGDALVAQVHCLDLDELGVLQVRRAREIAHQGRDARVRLRITREVDLEPRLLDLLQVYTVGDLLDQLLQQVHRLSAVGLQALDDLLARKQRGDLGLELLDLFDLLVEPGVLPLQVLVPVALVGDVAGDRQVDGTHDQEPEHRDQPSQDAEVLALGLAARFAPGEQVDADHASNLRIARPHATIREGASATSFFSGTRGEMAMLANGLATRVLIWVRLWTISSSAGMTAEPPVSRTCSTDVYCVDVKKNC